MRETIKTIGTTVGLQADMRIQYFQNTKQDYVRVFSEQKSVLKSYKEKNFKMLFALSYKRY
jgi:hypothetical protein